MLHANKDSHSWIIFTNSEEGLVVYEYRADQHDAVELAEERAVDPPQTWICLNSSDAPTIKVLNGMFSGSFLI